MKKLIFLITLTILIAACTPGQVRTIPQPTPVHTGTQGVVFIPMRDAPPAKIIESTSVPLAFRIENRGAYDIEYGRYWLGGISEEYFTVSDEDTFVRTGDNALGSYNLNGKSKFNPIGGMKVVTRQISAKKLRGTQQISSQKISPMLCYPYQTKATINVCIDTDPFNPMPTRVKVCDYKNAIPLTGGQGGPLVITSVETRMIQSTKTKNAFVPQFSIHLQNAGRGRLVKKDNYMDFCEGRANKDLIGWVTVTGFLSDQNLNCTTPRVDVAGTSLICTVEQHIPTTRGTYVAPLQITLDYGYVEHVTPILFDIVPIAPR
ncbi:MAG: hypothetical protein ACE5FT_07755 [Candidatus Nanoarchaeia archaeon]